MSAAYRRQRSITKGRMTPTESKSFEKGVEGGFELDLACLAALLGKIMMSQDVRFLWLFGKGSTSWCWLYQLPRGSANSTSPNRFFLVLGYEVSIAFS